MSFRFHILSAYVSPVMWESTVHTLTQTQAELYAAQSCVFYSLRPQLPERNKQAEGNASESQLKTLKVR